MVLSRSIPSPTARSSSARSRASSSRPSSRRVSVGPAEHLLVVGQTRSGKSTWIRAALGILHRSNPRRRVVVLDTKGEAQLRAWSRRHRYAFLVGPRAAAAALRHSRAPIRLHVLVHDPVSYDANALLEALYATGNLTVVFDEAMHWPKVGPLARGLRLLLTAGMGRNVGVWAATQRPVDVANVFVSESIKRVVFRVELESDRKKLAGFIPGVDGAAGLDRFCWLYHAAGLEATVFGPLRP